MQVSGNSNLSMWLTRAMEGKLTFHSVYIVLKILYYLHSFKTIVCLKVRFELGSI